MPSSLDDYEVICTVGSGSYGICQKIRRKRDGKVLVWKELDYGEMSESEKQLLVSEVNLLRELKHEHIVRYYDRIIDRPHTRLYIIMEYCEGGDLSTLIASLKKNGGHCEEDFVWRICVQTVNALCECHSRSSKLGKAVLHRDLKPANVFLDANRNVKLGDFGLARVLNHDTSFAKTFVGTPYYMSPELMNYMSYNEKSDIWSLGCLLYELCALKPPFTASSQTELASKVRVGHFSRLPLRYSNDLNTVISFMLQVDEEKRPSVEALADHKLIVKHDPNRQHTLVASPPINGTHKTRPGSGASDEGYGSHAKSLKRREEMLEKRQEDLLARIKALEEKEKLLREREKASEDKEKKIMKFMLKEKELEAREKTVELREKMVDDKMAKVEKILTSADKSSLVSPRNGSIMTPSYTGSCSHMHCVDCSCTVDQLAAKTNSPHSAILLPAAKGGHQETQDGQTGETEYFRRARERLCSLENRTLAKRKDSEGRKKCVKKDGSVERRHHSRQGDSGALLKRRDGSQENRRPLRLHGSHDVILQRERRHSEKEKYICDTAEKTKTPLIARKHCCRLLQMKDVAKNICPKASEDIRIDGLDGMRVTEMPPVNVPKSPFGCGHYRL